MIDHENEIFEKVSTALRENFPDIYVIGREISDTPPSFPAVSITQSANEVNSKYSTFRQIEHAANEVYKFEIASNLEVGREKQCKEILQVIDSVMSEMFYYTRRKPQSVPAIDPTVARLIARYENNSSTY